MNTPAAPPPSPHYDRLLAEIRREFPSFRLVVKSESRGQRALHQLLRLVTFGAQSHYLTHYQTTIGQTVYVTSDWSRRSDLERTITMRHERVHLRQFHKYGLVPMAILYLLVPFPVGLAYFRARFEMAAYAETIAATAELRGIDRITDPTFRDHILAQFISGAYGWMWPFRASLLRWYDAQVTKVRAFQHSSGPAGDSST